MNSIIVFLWGFERRREKKLKISAISVLQAKDRKSKENMLQLEHHRDDALDVVVRFRCSLCHMIGHNRRTCRANEESKQVEDDDEAQDSGNCCGLSIFSR